MKHSVLILACTATAFALAAGGFLAGRAARDAASPMAAAAPATGASAPGKVLYWHDPMVPDQHFDKPGKSPFMDMQLVPVYADAAGDGGVSISAGVQQNLGIRTTTVRREDVAPTFDAVGTVQFDDRLAVAVPSRVAGWVEHLAVRAPMERVRRGQPLATVFAPDWLAPQNELLALERAGAPRELVDAARDRLRALSVPDELVRRSEQAGSAQARFVVAAPVDGVVSELGVREGAAVAAGTTLFRLAGLEKVWAVAQVPEAQAVHLARGWKVKAVSQADRAQAFEGTLDEILPQVDAGTRTLQARFEVDNRAGRLVPGMLLQLQVAGPARTRLVLPAEAVIRTGRRTVALLQKPGGRFEPRDVQLGVDLGDRVEITGGLVEGDAVVASGQFLVDSEANLRGAVANLAAAPATPASAPLPVPDVHEGQGRIERIDAHAITLSHGPIATMDWPAMTMAFAKPAPAAFPDAKVGDTVRFRFRRTAAGFELLSVDAAGSAR